MANLLQDVRFAFRLLLRHPGVTLVAVASLALGIGANTTVFTLVNAILLQPMPIRGIGRVVMVGTTETRNGAPVQLGGLSRPNFEDLRQQNASFSGTSLVGFTPIALAGDGEPEQVFGQLVSGEYFDVLGPELAAGRTLGPDDDRELGARPVAVMSYGLWQRRFGGRADMVGQSVTLNGHSFTVVGVTADGLVVLGMNVGTQGFDEPRGRDLYRRALERLSGVPGVQSATLSTAVPLVNGGFARTAFRDDEDIKDPRNGRLVQVNEVGERYFETLGIPIVRGRGFRASDRAGSPPVILINEAMARQVFQNEEPIGRRLHIFNRPPAREIVGIAKTIKYNFVGEDDTAHMYLPIE